MCVNVRIISVLVLVGLAGWSVPARADAGGSRDSDCTDSAAFTIDNRGGAGAGGAVTVYQRAVGIFLADVPFNNTFKAVVSGWGGGSPGSVTFSLNGQQVTIPYGGDGAETSAFDMGNLPSGPCAVTSILTVMAKNSSGVTVAQTSVPVKCVNRPFFMPPNMYAKSLSPLQWSQPIVYELYPQLSFMNLNATWEGENDLFKNFGGLISGGELTIEFNGKDAEFTFGIKADLNITQERPTLDSLFKAPTNQHWMGWKQGTDRKAKLTAGFSAKAKISDATGCFDGGLEVCADGQFGYEWTFIPIGPIFPPLPLFITGKAGFAIGPEMCFNPWDLDLDCWYVTPMTPFTEVDVNIDLSGQGGLELGFPGVLSVFGGFEGDAGGKIHVCGDPVTTCWGLPYLADLTFDLSIVGYARALFFEWELGRWVIVNWSCLDKSGVLVVPLDAGPVVMRKAGRPYLENGEPYAHFELGSRQGADVKRDGSRGEADELITENTNLEATPAVAGFGNLTLVATSEDDPNTPAYVEHEIYAAFRDGAVWGPKMAVTNNTDSDVQPTAAFDASGKPIVAWVTLPGTTGEETLAEMKAKMEIAYSVYHSGTQTWSVPVQLTSDSSLDAMPQLVRGGDGSANLVWLHSADNSLPIAPGELPGSPPSVMAASWNGTAFISPQVLLPSCDAAGAIRYARDASGREYLLWTRDVDADPGTIQDHEVVESHTVGGVWTDPVLLTSNDVADTAVGLLATSGGVIGYYVRAGEAETQPQDLLVGRVFDGSQWSNEVVLISAPTSILSPSFSLATDGSVTCAWIGPGFNAEGKTVLYATSPNGRDNWSEPQDMAVTSLPTAPACTYAAGNIQVCYVSARAARGAEKIGFGLKDSRSTAFDVRLLDHAPYSDLWVEPAGIAVSPQPPVGGQAATITVTAHLSGDFPQTSVSVEVFDGDPSQGGTLIGSTATDLAPGGQAALEFPWTYPSDFNQHELYVFVDRGNAIPELNENNNSAHVAIGGLNLRAASVRVVMWAASNVGVEITVQNTGYADLTNVGFELRRDSQSGPLILAETLPVVPASGSVQSVVPWDITLTPAGRYSLFLIVDPSGVVNEQDVSDNTVSGIVPVLPDLQAEQWSASITSGTAHVTVRNVGAKPMVATIARVTSGQQNLGEATVAAMAAGGSTDVEIPLSVVPAGSLSIIINPDSNGSDEVTLLNNTAVAVAYSRGDMNCNGAIGVDDVTLFVEALLDPGAFDAAHPNCGSIQVDINQSGVADGADIQQFVNALLGN